MSTFESSFTGGPTLFQAAAASSASLRVVYRYEPVDCNGNGVHDPIDVSSGNSADCDLNGFPDECEHDHDSDGIPDACDAQCLAAGPDSDGDGILDLCDTVIDCDSDDIPDSFEIDRNGNGFADTCEFTGDCNLNGLPDALDLQIGTSDDFDDNDVPDECQTTGQGFFLDCQCQPHTTCDALPNTTGAGAQLAAEGSCRVGLNRFSLLATHLPANRSALFFQGPLGVPAHIGLGFRCVASPQYRLGTLQSDASGTARFDLDFAALHGSGVIQPWDTRAFQVAFRDLGPDGPAIHFSETLYLSFCP